jgi:hypothetical protein
MNQCRVGHARVTGPSVGSAASSRYRFIRRSRNSSRFPHPCCSDAACLDEAAGFQNTELRNKSCLGKTLS